MAAGVCAATAASSSRPFCPAASSPGHDLGHAQPDGQVGCPAQVARHRLHQGGQPLELVGGVGEPRGLGHAGRLLQGVVCCRELPAPEQHPALRRPDRDRDLGCSAGVLPRRELERPFCGQDLVQRDLGVSTEAGPDRAQHREGQGGRPSTLGRGVVETGAGGGQLPVGAGQVQVGECQGGPAQRDLGPRGFRGRGREVREQGVQRDTLGSDEEPGERQVVDEVVTDETPLSGQDGLPDRRKPLPLRVQPLRRGLVQPRHEAGLLERELAAQELTEERVIAEGEGGPGHRFDERVPARHEAQLANSAAPLGQRLHQTRFEHVDEAGPQQELTGARRLLGQHLAHQVGRDVACVTTELPDRGADVLPSGKAHLREPQPRRPAAGPLHQSGHVALGEAEPRLLHQLRRLRPVEGQIAGTDLGESPVEPVTVQGKRRVRPGQQGDAEPTSRTTQQRVQTDADGRREQHLTAVEDPSDRPVEGGQRPGHRGQVRQVGVSDVRAGAQVGNLHPGTSEAFESSDPEGRRSTVRFVQLHHEARRARLPRRPDRREDGLAVAGRRAQQRQRAVGTLGELLEQALARHGPREPRRAAGGVAGQRPECGRGELRPGHVTGGGWTCWHFGLRCSVAAPQGPRDHHNGSIHRGEGPPRGGQASPGSRTDGGFHPTGVTCPGTGLANVERPTARNGAARWARGCTRSVSRAPSPRKTSGTWGRSPWCRARSTRCCTASRTRLPSTACWPACAPWVWTWSRCVGWAPQEPEDIEQPAGDEPAAEVEQGADDA